MGAVRRGNGAVARSPWSQAHWLQRDHPLPSRRACAILLLIRQEQDEDQLAFIAHDLRTPLNALSLLVDELSLSLLPQVLEENAETFNLHFDSASRHSF